VFVVSVRDECYFLFHNDITNSHFNQPIISSKSPLRSLVWVIFTKGKI
jgi:hypothetical protein